MSKEAQIKELAEEVGKYHIGCNLPKECYAECDICAAEALYELGYRKMEGEPPLLEPSLARDTFGNMKDQRDADIKWMRGE